MDSVKEPEIETESWMGIEKMANDLGDVLSRHLGILRREISFLRTEATLRSRDSAGTGKKACQEQQIRNVNLPYLATLSPMQFTASTPGIFPFSSVAGPALEIYSIRLVNLNPNLSWPIDDLFLHLIGPCRAIVADETVMFQIELKVKYGAHFEATALCT
ncbi:hypothetical protein ZWY2020_047970, partial [Hordeum vulgare]